MKICKNTKRLLAALYLLAAALWLCAGVFSAVRVLWAKSRGEYLQTTLSADEVTLQSFVNYADLEWSTPPYQDPDLYLSTDSDPQILWEGTAYLENVALYAEHYTPPGSVVLYYRLPGQTDYRETQKVFASIAEPGVYTFELGGKTVSGLRIDPDSMGGISTRFTGVRLNPPVLWFARFVPGAGQLLLLLTLPAVAAAVLRLLFEIANCPPQGKEEKHAGV